MAPVAGVLGLGLRYIRLVDVHGPGQLHDDETILVRGPNPSGVGQAEALHRKGTGRGRPGRGAGTEEVRLGVRVTHDALISTEKFKALW